MGSEAVGAELEVVAVGVGAAFGREHYLCGTVLIVSGDWDAKARIHVWGLAGDVRRHY